MAEAGSQQRPTSPSGLHWRLLGTAVAIASLGALIALLPGPQPRPLDAPDTAPQEVGTAGVAGAGGEPSMEQVQAAAADQRAAGGAHQDEVALRFEQAVVMLHAGQHTHAITALQRVLALAPQMPEAWVNMGYARLGLQHYPEAAAAFGRAIDLRPGQTNAYYGLGLALHGLGDLPGARGAMRSYLHLVDPQDTHRERAAALLDEWEREPVE